MELANEQIAEAFSHHDFEAAYPYLAEDIRWNLVGERLVEGKEKVIAVCRESAAYLTGVTTDFVKLRIVATDDCVVIDSVAEYTDKEEKHHASRHATSTTSLTARCRRSLPTQSKSEHTNVGPRQCCT